MATVGNIQLGKNGVTEGFIEALTNLFKKHSTVKVSVLKSLCRDRLALQELSNDLLFRLGELYTARIIGYTIALKKHRKALR